MDKDAGSITAGSTADPVTGYTKDPVRRYIQVKPHRERLTAEFLSLVNIESLSLKERKMADKLMEIIRGMGYEAYEDDAGIKAGGDSGNVIFNVKASVAENNVKKCCGSEPAALFLMAHMDTVGPAADKKIIIDGDIIKTDGTTILGGDDAAGIVCILESLRLLKENNIPHGDIQVAFTIAEETGLTGAKLLDYSKIKAKLALIFDEGGSIGSIAVKAPSQYKVQALLKGKASHAGVSPEEGISAIQIAARAIDRMKLGRIDEETTSNIGIITGGTATHIICDTVKIEGECRSRDDGKLESQKVHMTECLEEAAAHYGGKAEVNNILMFSSFTVSEDDNEIMPILKVAAERAEVKLKLESTGGGSDTNIVSGKGIKAVNVSVGMKNAHSTDECINIADMADAARFLTEIIRAVGEV